MSFEDWMRLASAVAKAVGFVMVLFYSCKSFSLWRGGDKTGAIWHLLLSLWFMTAIKA